MITDYASKKLPKEILEKLRSRIRELKVQGKPHTEIVSVLQTEGFKTAHGAPINLDYVRNALYRMRDLPKQSSKHQPVVLARAILKGRGSDAQKIQKLEKVLLGNE